VKQFISHINKFKQTVNNERSFVQIKLTSGQHKIIPLRLKVYGWEVYLEGWGYEGSDQETAWVSITAGFPSLT